MKAQKCWVDTYILIDGHLAQWTALSSWLRSFVLARPSPPWSICRSSHTAPCPCLHAASSVQLWWQSEHKPLKHPIVFLGSQLCLFSSTVSFTGSALPNPICTFTSYLCSWLTSPSPWSPPWIPAKTISFCLEAPQHTAWASPGALNLVFLSYG